MKSLMCRFDGNCLLMLMTMIMMKFGWKLFVNDAEEVGRCRSGLEDEDEDGGLSRGKMI